MKKNLIVKTTFLCMIILPLLQSCKSALTKEMPRNFIYSSFRDSIRSTYDTTGDNSNIFDTTLLTPGTDSSHILLKRIDTAWHRDLFIMQHIDSLRKTWKKMDDYTPADLSLIKENTQVLDSFLTSKVIPQQKPCREKECLLYAQVVKSKQILFLYLDAVLIDSFPVSTGVQKHETPDINTRASGPLFKKYTSKKYPEGNYRGLGNMPYSVFVKGGYAIHGTTTGNLSKLGSRASHGCIRLHPVNAKIFYELVRLIGISNTWVSVSS